MKKEMKGKKIGLALGGGSVLGAAHIGILRALEEKGIKPDYIAGTSIGAVVGALYAFGKNSKEIEEIALGLKWRKISKFSLSKYALLSNKKLGKQITKHIGEKKIEDANIPLGIVTTDATTGEKVVLKKGDVTEAIRASTCLPGIFAPEIKDGKILIDGGTVENVPAETVREMGAEYVISVDLIANYKHKEPRNVVEVLMNAFDHLMVATSKTQEKESDLMIKPNLSPYTKRSTKYVKKIIERGYEEGKEVIKNV